MQEVFIKIKEKEYGSTLVSKKAKLIMPQGHKLSKLQIIWCEMIPLF